VAIWGERLQQFHVQVIPEQLALYGVSIRQVMEATSEALDEGILMFSSGATIGTGGAIGTANQQIGIRHVPSIVVASDLEHVTLVGRGGRAVRMSDVAVLKEDHMPLWGDAVINDGPGLMLIVEKFPWANTLDVTRGVEAALDELSPGLTGIAIDSTIFRPATFIEVALGNLTNALLLGSILVFVVLIVFPSAGDGLISLVAIRQS
jgi:Cu/Ag efflux pump CusA